MMEFRANINGIDVKATYSRRAIDGIFLPLLQRITAMQREKGSPSTAASSRSGYSWISSAHPACAR